MRTMFVSLLAVCFVVPGVAQAQFKDLIKREGKKAIEKEIEDLKKGDEESGDKESGDKESGAARPGPRKDKDRKFPPGLSYSTVLNGVNMHAKKGLLSIHHIQATFLPEDCKDGYIVLRTADGSEIYQFNWQRQTLEKPYSLLGLSTTKDLRTGENVSGSAPLSTPGDYVLDFYMPSEHFYTFPFSLVKIGSGEDPFGAGECYSLNGDWQSWGYLYYRDAKPDQSLQWKVWLRHQGCEPKLLKIRIEIHRDGDGEVVCSSRELTTHSLQPKWTRIAFDMVFPKGKEVPHGTYFKAKDLLTHDGDYTLKMSIDEAPYGTWKFSISGGKLQYTGRTLRGQVDPMTFVEGGRDAWWYAKEP